MPMHDIYIILMSDLRRLFVCFLTDESKLNQNNATFLNILNTKCIAS